MLARCVATLKPPPELTLSQWADRYRMLSAESSAEPGRWHTDKAPYQREIMDAIGDAHIRRVVIMCAAQLGKTELLLNILGYFMAYDAFTNALIRQIGAALEIPPEVLFKQFTTSYSAARGALNEFWRTCSMQRDWFTDDFCQPIYEEWFAEAVARGRIAAPGFFADPAIRKAYTACAWNGPARTNLNPVQEVDAAVKRVDAGFSTAQEETATMTGGDYNRNIRQRVIEAKRKREVDEITNPQASRPAGNRRNDNA